MIISLFKLQRFRRKWAKQNANNQTVPRKIFDKDYVSVGQGTYGGLSIENYGKQSKLYIGNYVSIGPNVSFILNSEHDFKHVSSYPYKVKVLKSQKYEACSKGDIIVSDDVWIGYGATILSGVHIGQGAVVAAGAVVTHDVEPYSIVGGVPAKSIKKRFSDEVISYFLTLDYGKLTENMIRDYVDELYKPIDHMQLEDIKKLYCWFPKKEFKYQINNSRLV